MRLPNLSGYLKLPGPFPVARIELQYVERETVAPAFEASPRGPAPDGTGAADADESEQDSATRGGGRAARERDAELPAGTADTPEAQRAFQYDTEKGEDEARVDRAAGAQAPDTVAARPPTAVENPGDGDPDDRRESGKVVRLSDYAEGPPDPDEGQDFY